MKIMTVLGTRPEIIRLSVLIRRLDELSEHILVHTGQNFDDRLSRIFFDELGVRNADVFLDVRGDSFGSQAAQILERCEKLMLQHRPDRLLILGDTNSGLSAVVAKRLGIPVYHMEAGNRCYDDRVPEEVNRRIIDHSSDILMPYTERSRQNLLREGIDGARIFVTGNPIYEVMRHYDAQIAKSQILAKLGLSPQKYFLVTMHRAENVDVGSRLSSLVQAISRLQQQYQLPVVVSTHPHTRLRMDAAGLKGGTKNVEFLPPFGFFDFVTLERNAFCVLSDSGTVQEECAILGIPNVTIRDVTERPETLECGTNILSGCDPDTVMKCVNIVLNRQSPGKPPAEYVVEHVSEVVLRILLGFRRGQC